MSKAPKSLSLQLKRKQQTFIVTLNTQTPRYSDIKRELFSIIQQVGGVHDFNYAPTDEEEDGDGDIPISAPTYGGLDSDESDNEQHSNDTPSKGKVLPKLTEMVIGVPKDISDIYGSGFKDVTNEQEKIPDSTKSFAIFAFRLQEEKFNVQEPKIDDEE